jgi:hypothetical protein
MPRNAQLIFDQLGFFRFRQNLIIFPLAG